MAYFSAEVILSRFVHFTRETLQADDRIICKIYEYCDAVADREAWSVDNLYTY